MSVQRYEVCKKVTNSKSSVTAPRSSITEETVKQYLKVGDSLAGQIAKHGLRVRDFVLLSFVCDQGSMDIAQLVIALGLGQSSTLSCIDRLGKTGLIRQQTGPDDNDSLLISATTLGRSVVQKLDAIDEGNTEQ